MSLLTTKESYSISFEVIDRGNEILGKVNGWQLIRITREQVAGGSRVHVNQSSILAQDLARAYEEVACIIKVFDKADKKGWR